MYLPMSSLLSLAPIAMAAEGRQAEGDISPEAVEVIIAGEAGNRDGPRVAFDDDDTTESVTD